MINLAFLISAHTDEAHLKRLVDALPESADFYIHIDQKSDIDKFKKLLGDNGRVTFLTNRENVEWGSWLEVKYQMSLIRAALSSARHYDYLITISGMDYPVWSNQRIMDYFGEMKADGREIIDGIKLDEDDKAYYLYSHFRFLACRHWRKGSIKSRFRSLLRKYFAILPIKKPFCFYGDSKMYHLYKGAAWWAISTELAKLVLSSYDNDRKLVKYFQTSFCPAETFVQTIAFNSEFADKCLLKKGAYTNLNDLTPFTYIDYNPVVKVLTGEDYSRVKDSGKMFCRKTRTDVSDEFMNMIDSSRE